MHDDMPKFELQIDALYLEELYTDHRTGTIRKLTPVDADGKPDPNRKVQFWGQTQVLTQMGPLPLSFELQGDNLQQAAANFPQAAGQELERTLDELKELRRQQTQSIVTPGSAGGMQGGGIPGGGIPGGGLKIP